MGQEEQYEDALLDALVLVLVPCVAQTAQSTVGRSNSCSTPVVTLSLTFIMSSERPSETNHMRKIAGTFKGKLSSLLHLSRAPTPSSIEMDSSSDNPAM
jgi:hypothetical protein